MDNGDILRLGREADREQPVGYGCTADDGFDHMYEEAHVMLVCGVLPVVPKVIAFVS